MIKEPKKAIVWIPPINLKLKVFAIMGHSLFNKVKSHQNFLLVSAIWNRHLQNGSTAGVFMASNELLVAFTQQSPFQVCIHHQNQENVAEERTTSSGNNQRQTLQTFYSTGPHFIILYYPMSKK